MGNKRFLASDWVKYVAVLLLSVVIWVPSFGAYHAPKPTEKIELFFAGRVRDRSFGSVAKNPALGIKRVVVSSSDPSDSRSFSAKYPVVGLGGADVLIIPLSVAEKTDAASAFLPLDGVGEPFRQGGEAYGAFLPEEALGALSHYFEFSDERYAVFVSASSVNAGKLTDRAIEFAKWLVKYV